MQRAQVWSLVGELSSHTPCGQEIKFKKKKYLLKNVSWRGLGWSYFLVHGKLVTISFKSCLSVVTLFIPSSFCSIDNSSNVFKMYLFLDTFLKHCNNKYHGNPCGWVWHSWSLGHQLHNGSEAVYKDHTQIWTEEYCVREISSVVSLSLFL